MAALPKKKWVWIGPFGPIEVQKLTGNSCLHVWHWCVLRARRVPVKAAAHGRYQVTAGKDDDMKRIAALVILLITAACGLLRVASACSDPAQNTIVTQQVGQACEPAVTSGGCATQNVYLVWNTQANTFSWEYQATGGSCTCGQAPTCGTGN